MFLPHFLAVRGHPRRVYSDTVRTDSSARSDYAGPARTLARGGGCPVARRPSDDGLFTFATGVHRLNEHAPFCG